MVMENISNTDLEFLKGHIPLEFIERGDMGYKEFIENYSMTLGNPHYALYYLVLKFGNNFYSDFNDGETVFKFYLMVDDILIICIGGDSLSVKMYVKKGTEFLSIEKKCKDIIKYLKNDEQIARDAIIKIDDFKIV